MVALVSLKIEHFRGFYKTKSFKFAIPNGRLGSGLTILVGPNNSGKTTVIDAIKLLKTNSPQLDKEHRHGDCGVKIVAKNTEGETVTLTNLNNSAVCDVKAKDKDNKVITSNASQVLPLPILVPSRRSWSPYTGTSEVAPNAYWPNKIVANTLDVDGQLVGRLAKIERDGEKDDYNKIIKRIIPDVCDWKIELSRQNNFVEYKTKSGAEHSSQLFGDGMSSLFRIALGIFDTDEGNTLIIDEPELSFHPQAQKRLACELSRAASKRQIILTTHSPYFINWSDIINGAEIHRFHRDRGRGLQANKLKTDTIKKLEMTIKDYQKPSLLDVVAKEVFFAEEVVFLEGPEDVGVLRNFAFEEEMRPLEVFGYGSGGAGSIKHFLQIAKDLGIPAAAIYDGDQRKLYNAAKRLFPNAHIELLKKDDIRDKPDETNPKDGLFDKGGKIKPEHKDYVVEMITRINKFFEAKSAA